ncbi:hypothetical protein Tco_1148436 [Tanacetum coccineum]
MLLLNGSTRSPTLTPPHLSRPPPTSTHAPTPSSSRPTTDDTISVKTTPSPRRSLQQEKGASGMAVKTAGGLGFVPQGVFVCSVAGKPQKEVFGLGGSRHRGVGLAAGQPGIAELGVGLAAGQPGIAGLGVGFAAG